MTNRADEEAALAYLTDRRNRLHDEIVAMTGRMREIDYLISELATPVPVKLAPQDNFKKPSKASIETILNLVRDRGANGATAEYIANLTGVPRGTASSRLSVLRSKGILSHHKPVYFYIEKAAPLSNGDAS